MTIRVAKSQRLSTKTETEVAVLQVRLSVVEEKFNDIKEDLKNVNLTMEKNHQEINKVLNEIKKSNDISHEALEKKVSSLEKWRWMLMGAGIVLGSIGFDTISKLLQ
jgi:uncharacterized coiled-coil DUF342 family protein